MWVLSVGFEWKLFTRAHIEFKRQSQISVRQRRIWGRNFKTKLLTSSVFSCFLPSIFIHLSIQHNLTLKRKKQENTEKVRSLVLKFLPKIFLCHTLICDCFLKSMPPKVCILVSIGSIMASAWMNICNEWVYILASLALWTRQGGWMLQYITIVLNMNKLWIYPILI